MVLFGNIARLADELAREPSKLKKRAAIAAALAQAAGIGGNPPAAGDGVGAGDATRAEGSPAAVEAGRFCLYLAGQPFAEADGRKLNAGGAILSRAVKEVAGADDAALGAAYRRHGDLGAAAYDLLAPLAPPFGKAPEATLRLEEVASAFDTMATARSTAARFSAVEGLLRRATALEAKYLLKLMLGDMRIGVAQPLVEEAIAVASGTDVAAVRHAVMLEADLSRAVKRAFAGTLAEARMTLFHPLGFMLASPVETPEEAVERFTPKPPKTAKPRKVPTPRPAKKPRRKKGAADEEVEVEAEAFVDLAPDAAATATDAAREGLAEDVELSAHAGDAVDPGPVSAVIAAPVIQALVEDKFDGMRAQLHCGDPSQPGRVALYSRNREDVTHSFPELEEAFRQVAKAAPGEAPGPVILDGEILGWDYATGKALPFAILGQRIGRKRVDNELRRQIPVVYVAFDVLFHAGELVLPLPLRERRARLEAIAAAIEPLTLAPIEKAEAAAEADAQQGGLFFPDLPAEIVAGAAERATGREPLQRLRLSNVRFVEGAEAIDQAYRDARGRANEGVMLKAAESPYLAGRRGIFWLKLKRELATLDVVITGAEFGSGRRARFLSDYTFAVRGPAGPNGEAAELLNVGKAYSGVTDAEIVELTEWLQAHTLEDAGHFRTVEPIRVLEVAFNNVMRSDRHRSGFALRFPRILRIRDDKPVEEIDTLERVEEIYRSQPDRPVESDDGDA